MMLFSVFISKFSAISRSSMKSLGRLFCRYVMSVLMKSVPISFSNRFVRPSPGGVMHIPLGFSRKIFSSAISSIEGRIISFLDGMNTVAPLMFLRYFGGRYIAFPLRFEFDIMWLMVLSEEMMVEFRRSALTSFVGVINSKSAPQKVRPRPMKARMDDSYRIEGIREIMPKDSRMYPIIPDGLVRVRIWMQPLIDKGL